MDSAPPPTTPPRASWLQRHSALATLLALLVIALSCWNLGHFLRAREGPEAGPMLYYYDLAHDRLFAAPERALSPIVAPGASPDDEPTGLRAYVYACGPCGPDAERLLGWVERYSEEAKAEAEARQYGIAIPESKRVFTENAHQVARPVADDPEWKTRFVAFGSPEGQEILAYPAVRCADAVPTPCLPERGPDNQWR